MTTRRTFLGAMAGGLSMAMAGGRLGHAAAGQKPPLGLQLWSIKHLLEKDFPGTLKQVKDWGFDEVESAGFYGMSAAEFTAGLKNAGLQCHAMHIGWDLLGSDMSQVIQDAEVVGATTIIQPSLPHQNRGGSATREEMMRAAEAFSKWSKELRAAGKRFAYHMHSQEFGPSPKGTLFDEFVEVLDPQVGFELDVFWVTAGGVDPLELMRKHPGRIWYTHLKDMAKEGGTGPDAKVILGTGQIDIAGVVKAGEKAGVEIHFIEDESRTPEAQIPESVAYYKTLTV